MGELYVFWFIIGALIGLVAGIIFGMYIENSNKNDSRFND